VCGDSAKIAAVPDFPCSCPDASAVADRSPAVSAATPLSRWLLSSGADVGGRLLLQIGATVLFTQLLGAADFGYAALVAVYVNALSMIVTAPFEEALTQRRRVRKRHFAAALAAALLLAALLWTVVVLPLSLLLPLAGDAGEVFVGPAPLLLYGLILFADGPLSIYTAIARRQRRFGDIALGNLVGLAAGTAAGLGIALGGGGVWALLAVQPVARIVNLALVISRCPITVRPRWALAPLRQLSSFGGWYLGGRVLDGVSDALVQTLVTRLFGLDGNGYLNMAMRVIEPVRGAAAAIGHNLATAHFTRLQADPGHLGRGVQAAVVETALVLQPVFIGLALTTPMIIAVIGGPDWSAAGPVAVLLALAAAVGSASNFVHSGIAARGRADLGFLSCLIDLVLVAIFLLLLSPLGLIAIGLARLLSWLIDATWIVLLARRLLGLEVAPAARAMGRTSLASAGMAAAVLAVDRLLLPAGSPDSLRLVIAVGTGMAAYGVLIGQLQGPLARALLGRLRR
jgi:O-antigen/teichoic acid export membrane protein